MAVRLVGSAWGNKIIIILNFFASEIQENDIIIVKFNFFQKKLIP
jgi:hypothetical protein